jgi:glycosyltransferase involved in cell wall biosynthesis
MRVAMVGQRGVPATFGGVERAVEELGAELVARGHDVTVFCRRGYTSGQPSSYRGMHLRYVPTVDRRGLEALVPSALSAALTVTTHFDIVHFHALGPGLFTPLPRWLSSAGVVQTIHGLDDRRAKWGPLASRLLATAGWMSARVPDATIVVSAALAEHYRREHGRATATITNGVRRPLPLPPDFRPPFALAPKSYLLFVGRLVPEKAPDLLLRAFARLDTNRRLVVAGGSSHTEDYVEELHALAARDPRVLMAGYVHGEELARLYAGAVAFVLPSLLEGLPLVLLEAASYAVPIIASDIEPHVEVLGGIADPGRRLFRSGDEHDLVEALQHFGNDGLARAAAARLATDVIRDYTWPAAAAATEGVYQAVLDARAGRLRFWRPAPSRVGPATVRPKLLADEVSRVAAAGVPPAYGVPRRREAGESLQGHTAVGTSESAAEAPVRHQRAQ